MNHDKVILEGCKNGDRKAQEQLYKNYYKTMVSLCIRYTGNNQDAVEVLNNGFLKIFKSIHRYEPGKASLYTWIRTIIINSCLDFLKIKQKAITLEPLDINTDTTPIDAEAIQKMKTAELLFFVKHLPVVTNTVFNLYVMEDYSHKEIGQLLGIAEGTSKWHLSEARKQLKQMIYLQEVKI